MDFQLNIAALKTYCDALQASIDTLTALRERVNTSSTTIIVSGSGSAIDTFKIAHSAWSDNMQTAISKITEYHDALSGEITTALGELAGDAEAVCSVIAPKGIFSGGSDFSSTTVSLLSSAASSVHTNISNLQTKLTDQVAQFTSMQDHTPCNDMSFILIPTTFSDNLWQAKAECDDINTKLGDMDAKLSTYESNVSSFQSMVASKVSVFNDMCPEKYSAYSAADISAFLGLQQATIVDSLYQRYVSNPNSWKRSIGQDPDDISEAEYAALALYYLNDCDTAEKQEEFLNAGLDRREIMKTVGMVGTTGTGEYESYISQKTVDRFNRITGAAQSIYDLQVMAACGAYANYDALVLQYGEDVAAAYCYELLHTAGDTAGRLGLLQATTSYASQRLKDFSGTYVAHEVRHVSIQVGDLEETPGKTQTTQTITFSERNGWMQYRGVVDNYFDKALLSLSAADDAKAKVRGITGVDPNGELANSVGEAVLEKAGEKAWEKVTEKLALEVVGDAAGETLGVVKTIYDIADEYYKNVQLIKDGEEACHVIDVSASAGNLNLNGTHVIVQEPQTNVFTYDMVRNDNGDIKYEDKPFSDEWNLRIGSTTHSELENHGGGATLWDAMNDPAGTADIVKENRENCVDENCPDSEHAERANGGIIE